MAKSELEIEHEWNFRKAVNSKPPVLIGAGAVLASAQLTPSWLVEGRIPRGAITMLAGPPGSSKSWLAYELAIALAQGADEWLGCPLRAAKGGERVLVLNYDNPTPELGRRMLRLGLQAQDPVFFHTPSDAPLRLPAESENLAAMVAAIEPSLILVDSLRQAHTSEENDSGEMATIMGEFKRWLQGSGAAVVLIHHTNKDVLASGTSAVRGSVEIPASCDVIVELDGEEARWKKHRSWRLEESDEALGFQVRDKGSETIVESKDTPKVKKR